MIEPFKIRKQHFKKEQIGQIEIKGTKIEQIDYPLLTLSIINRFKITNYQVETIKEPSRFVIVYFKIRSNTREAPKPPIISINSLPAMLKKGTFASLATALAVKSLKF